MNQRYLEIYEKLYKLYGPQHWWPAETPFEVIIGSILVQNTNWTNVELSLQRLKPHLSPEKLELLTDDELGELIRSSGYFNVKAKRIKSFLAWFKTYNYEFHNINKSNGEMLRKELLAVHGIGPETADVILLYVFQLPVFIADNYARRIFYRIGFDIPRTYEGLRKEVEESLPRSTGLLNEFHALLVMHGKTYCKKTPICHECPIRTHCAKRILKM